MAITITAFERSPDGGKGLARDKRVRWALELSGPSRRNWPSTPQSDREAYRERITRGEAYFM